MNRLLRSENLLAVFILLAASLLQAQAPTPISAALRDKIDVTVRQALTATGVPSASIAIVQGGAIAYLQAYGDSRIEPPTPALPSMRYSIGSISKQFTAAAVLLLAEQGKLSQRGYDSRIALPYLGLSGLLAARLCSAVHASARHCGQNSRPVGAHAARFRACDRMAI